MSDSLVETIINAEAAKLDAAKTRYPQLLDVEETTPKLAAELKEVATLLGKSLQDVRADARTRRHARELLARLNAGKGINARSEALSAKFKASTEKREKWLAEWEVSRRPLQVEEMEISSISGNARDAEQQLRKLKDENRYLFPDLSIPHAMNLFEASAE